MKVVIEVKDMGNAMRFNTTAKGFNKANINERFYSNFIAKIVSEALDTLETKISGVPDISDIASIFGEEEENANA